MFIWQPLYWALLYYTLKPGGSDLQLGGGVLCAGGVRVHVGVLRVVTPGVVPSGCGWRGGRERSGRRLQVGELHACTTAQPGLYRGRSENCHWSHWTLMRLGARLWWIEMLTSNITAPGSLLYWQFK